MFCGRMFYKDVAPLALGNRSRREWLERSPSRQPSPPGRGWIVRRLLEMSCAGVGRRVTEQAADGRRLLPLQGERVGVRASVKHFHGRARQSSAPGVRRPKRARSPQARDALPTTGRIFQRKGPARQSRNQRSADSLVRAKLASGKEHADKAVRAPGKSLQNATKLGDSTTKTPKGREDWRASLRPCS